MSGLATGADTSEVLIAKLKIVILDLLAGRQQDDVAPVGELYSRSRDYLDYPKMSLARLERPKINPASYAAQWLL
jgi:hypothetical protein